MRVRGSTDYRLRVSMFLAF